MELYCFQHLPITLGMVGKSRFTLNSLMNFGGKYIYRDNHERTEYNRICSEQMDSTVKSYIIKMGAIWISFVVCIINPTYVYFAHGIKATTPELHWPFCEPESNAEFTANLLLQVAVAVHAIMMYFHSEVFLSLFANVVTIVPRLTKLDLTYAIQLWKSKSISKLELYERFRNVTLQSLDLDK